MDRSRRITGLLASLLLVAALLAACGGAAPAAQEPAAPTAALAAQEPAVAEASAAPATASDAAAGGAALTGELLILEWAGYDNDDMNADFVRDYPGVKLNYELAASDADFLSKWIWRCATSTPSWARLTAITW